MELVVFFSSSVFTIRTDKKCYSHLSNICYLQIQSKTNDFWKKKELLSIVMIIAITSTAVGFSFIENDSKNNDLSHSELGIENAKLGFGGVLNDDESINLIFLKGDVLNLDETDGILQVMITYAGYDKDYGDGFVEMYSYKGELIHESQFEFNQKSDTLWEKEFSYQFDKNEVNEDSDYLGQYVIRIGTENGGIVGQSTFYVIMPSIQLTGKGLNWFDSGMGGVLGIKDSIKNLDFEKMNSKLSDSILKRYQSEILKDYYAQKISDSELSYFIEFKKINCSLEYQEPEEAEFLKLVCDLKYDR